MNVQDRLVALHHLDAPWRPSDLEQREGRIIRQGNKLYDADPENFQVAINRYATKQTLDSRMWQTIEGKANFIEQVRKGNSDVREIEDIAGEAANAAEMKAASSGNPLILEEMSLRQQIRKLNNERVGHDREQYRLRDAIRSAERIEAVADSRLKELKHDAKLEQPKQFVMTIDGETYDKRKDAGDAILKAAMQLSKSGKDDAMIGNYGGFNIHVEQGDYTNNFHLSLVGEGSYTTDFTSEADPVGLAMRATNTVKDLDGAAEQMEDAKVRAQADIPKLQKQVKPWPKQEELKDAKQLHADVLEQLKPKNKQAADDKVEKAKDSNPDVRYSLFSPSKKPGNGIPLAELQNVVDDMAALYNGNIPLTIRAVESMEELYGSDISEDVRNAKGFYLPTGARIPGVTASDLYNVGEQPQSGQRGMAALVARNLRSRGDARATFRHEVLGHFGPNTFTPDDKADLLKRISETRDAKELQPYWDSIDSSYGDATESLKAEEVFARIAEESEAYKNPTWRTKVLNFLNKLLRKIGLSRRPLTLCELRETASAISKGIRSGERTQKTFPRNNQS
ncbi:hypothetical protein RHD99_11060 [Buttiauxella selenatireducens]|uniref:Uncharacterized protein n=1 Tax=Buttiauxella selenatireducens TaxID=3073902 RepID=A0ABY9SG43_9ENTR|nr:hypothetical protein [Buttiauxella sp. R73]WMY76422.1 hypothetical protein RHD99_11060 [Buttiauxella sp. R73]